MGAWIEIAKERDEIIKEMSLPSWERGLKYSEDELYDMQKRRSPRGSVD